jgi:hypothetical protein
MDHLIQGPLTLPDIRILSTQRMEQGHWLIRVESALEGAQYYRCGWEVRDLHGLDAVVRLRQLALFDVPAVLEIRPTRYRCPCWTVYPTTMQRCAWYELRNPNVQAYEPRALWMLLNSTAADAARKLGVWHGGFLFKFVVAGATAIICSSSLYAMSRPWRAESSIAPKSKRTQLPCKGGTRVDMKDVKQWSRLRPVRSSCAVDTDTPAAESSVLT